jgi:serine protease Do
MKKFFLVLILMVFATSIVSNVYFIIKQSSDQRENEAFIISFRSDLDDAVNNLTNLQNKEQSLSTDINSLTESTTSLQTDFNIVKSNVSSINVDVSSLNSSVTSLTNAVQSLTQNTLESVSFVQSTNLVKPSVVVIEAQTVVTVFGRRITQQSAGTGWIINSNGFIVTNNHVIDGASAIQITLADGRSFPSVAVRTDAATDLAVIKINALGLPAIKIGNSDNLQVGQPVAAIGNALGLGINMTGGYISRLGTSITFSDGTMLSGLIGTDAPINPGNSGGPLVNLIGEVIGITNAKLVETGIEGIGYAININDAIKTINELIAKF